MCSIWQILTNLPNRTNQTSAIGEATMLTAMPMAMPTVIKVRARDKLLQQTVMERHRLIDRDAEAVEETTIDRGTITVHRMQLLETMPQVIQTREAVRAVTHLALSTTTTMRATMLTIMRENNADSATGVDLKRKVPSLPAKNPLTLCYKEWKSLICKTTRMILDMLVLGHIDMDNKSRLEVF